METSKNSEQPKKNEISERRYGLDIVMSFIAIAQAILILGVAYVVIDNHCRNRKFNEYIENNRSTLYSESVPIDSLQQDYTTKIKTIDDFTDKIVGLESDIMKSNDYFTIILSLITLCATLAVVIPYIVGKSISQKQISEEVAQRLDEFKNQYDDLLSRMRDQIFENKLRGDDAIRDAEIKFNELVSNTQTDIKTKVNSGLQSLEVKNAKVIKGYNMAEAHLSRMTAYLLLYKAGISKEQSPAPSQYMESFWAIGWAAKSLIRYANFYSNDYYGMQEFITMSLSIIKDANDNITKGENTSGANAQDYDGKIIRAFIDVYDAIQFMERKNIVVPQDFYNVLKTLWCKSKSFAGEDAIYQALVEKSKFRDYPDQQTDISVEDFRSSAERWIQDKLTS